MQKFRPERRKHPKLPAGFGSIRYLGPGRSNPYAVYPTTRGRAGKPAKAICYVSNWFVGVAVLAAWHAGEYEPGLPIRLGAALDAVRHGGAEINAEAPVAKSSTAEALTEKALSAEAPTAKAFTIEASAANAPAAKREASLDLFCQQMLHYFRAFTPSGTLPCTLQEGFETFYAWKYSVSAPRHLSESSANHDKWAFQHFSSLAQRQMDSITVDELQQAVDQIGLKRSAVDRAVTLIKGIYRHALSRELCTRNPAQYVRMPAVPASVSHQDFTDDELRVLWNHKEDSLVRMILIMCYSGFRWSAYLTMETNLEKGYFRGGVKTEAGRNRLVPIHSAIYPLVEKTLREEGTYLCRMNQYKFIREMARKMKELKIDQNGRHHTPHSCRHTFSRLCESYGVREADRKRMLGHSFGKDITNGVYGHRTLEELRGEIEKIKMP